ncbi:MAG: VOC family protein [Anaerolineales bacterium]|nr:VOC family protein [Anaerolineales bacterium]
MTFAQHIRQTNTILYCTQWAATVAFYRDRLGLPIRFANDWFVEFQLTEQAYLSIANAARATVDAVAGQGITLAWQLSNLDAARQLLLAEGVSVTAIQQKWGARVCYFHDPEGHRLELWAPLEPG